MDLKRIVVLLSFLCFYLLSIASEPLKIGILSDIHYLSEQLMDDGYAVDNYVYTTGKNIKVTPAVLDVVLKDYLESDIQVLLISGDITKDGEYQSHIDFVKKLRPLIEKGVRVYVIPGNHDINYPNPVSYRGNKTQPTPNITQEQFDSIYACTYKNILERDTSSLSYMVQLSDSVRLVTIDAARYREYTTKSLSSGKITASTEKWILKMLEEAQLENMRVIAMMHWGVVEHIMSQSLLFPDYLVNDWEKYAKLFADKGVKVVFTGHFHANDITAYTSPDANKLYDVETASLSSYPYAYRFAELSAEGIKISTKFVDQIQGDSLLQISGKETMLLLAKERAKGMLKNRFFSSEIIEPLSDVLAKIFVMHLRGDEKMDDSLRASIVQLKSVMGDQMAIDFYSIDSLDFYPEDNDIDILF